MPGMMHSAGAAGKTRPRGVAAARCAGKVSERLSVAPRRDGRRPRRRAALTPAAAAA
jgi:hypothetical protein